MQYVRSFAGSVSKTYNSINPATLSGAIDVIVIEQEDGTLACSPFHVRFGKFSLLRPFEKKVEFCVNGEKQDFAMKLGEGGEAFFVFETTNDIPASMQTSPLVSPAQSPETLKPETRPTVLSEPSYLDITNEAGGSGTSILENIASGSIPVIRREGTSASDNLVLGTSLPRSSVQPSSWNESTLISPGLHRAQSEELLPQAAKDVLERINAEVRRDSFLLADSADESFPQTGLSASPPSLKPQQAYDRAMTLSKKLSTSNIRSKVTDGGDLMLDMTGYKSSEDEALRAEAVARRLLSEELEGNYDIGSLIGTDENGNIWIYSSEEAKDAANKKAASHSLASATLISNDSSSDPGYHSDSDRSSSPTLLGKSHQRAQSEELPNPKMSGDASRNFAKTLRLTSPQLKQLDLKPGPNPISFTVNKATCTASMYLWRYDVPIVISDIDGTITKSDALGHILNMVGRDWTHVGVAKLYSDIIANGYNIFYLTSRSVGQADTTRTYLKGVIQDGWKLPQGPVIMSPDRTIAALRREVVLRKPEVFKMACLRDILGLFQGRTNPFYAGFGNRLTDALSYRTVNIPSSRIFTINSNAEVSLDLLTLNKYKSTYVSMREVVDHFFPPISTLVNEGGEAYTDFTYWRNDPGNLEDFQPTDSEDGDDDDDDDEEEEEEGEGYDDRLGDSYLSRDSLGQSQLESRLQIGDLIRESIEVDEIEDGLSRTQTRSDENDYTDDYLGDETRSGPRGHTAPL